MKRLLLTLALATAIPAVATAQQAPGNPGMPSPEMRQQMRANFEQMRKLHEQFRSQILGALTPAHRQLLASVVGNLAVSANPDRRAAVAQLDGALSSGEKTAILNDAKQFADQMKSMMAQMRAAHPWPKASGAPRPMHSHRPHKAPTAGGILLMVASGGGRGMPMGRFGGGPPHR